MAMMLPVRRGRARQPRWPRPHAETGIKAPMSRWRPGRQRTRPGPVRLEMRILCDGIKKVTGWSPMVSSPDLCPSYNPWWRGGSKKSIGQGLPWKAWICRRQRSLEFLSQGKVRHGQSSMGRAHRSPEYSFRVVLEYSAISN